MTARTTTLLQWNMDFNWKRCNAETIARRRAILSNLVSEHSPSIVFLQEAVKDSKCGLPPNLAAKYATEQHKNLVVAYLKQEWCLEGTPHTAPRAICVPLTHLRTGAKLCAWNVHFDTGMYSMDREDVRDDIKRNLRSLWDEVRKSSKDRTEIMVGDFNCPPYDALLLGTDFICTNRCLDWVQKRQNLPDRRLFNASWTLMSQRRSPLGTYYHSTTLHGPWLVFDQVLMSPDHVPSDKEEVVCIVSKAGGTNLASSGVGKPDRKVGSDHFPVVARIRIDGPA
jgi:endonuclease/exonuclease/phosphatase family metal-dependent hydrolase